MLWMRLVGPAGRRRGYAPATINHALAAVEMFYADRVFDELFAALRPDRGRALLAFYVSTGARASELLGVTVDRLNPVHQRIGAHRKGSGQLRWLPASADAFVWLRLYDYYRHRYIRNRMRIDFVLASASRASRVRYAFIDHEERGGEDGLGKGASDHALLVVDLAG